MNLRALLLCLLTFTLIACNERTTGDEVTLPVTTSQIIPQTIPQTESAITQEKVALLQPSIKLGQGQALAVAFDPSGKWMAVRTTAGVYLYDAHSLQMLEFPDVKERVSHLAFAPDGLHLVLALSHSNEIQIWQLPDMRLMHTLPGNGSTLLKLTFLPHGNSLIVSSFRAITVWDMVSGELLQTITPEIGSYFMEASASADGSNLVAAMPNRETNSIAAWRTGQDELFAKHEGGSHTWFVAGQFAPAGNLYGILKGVEVWGNSETLLVWNPATGSAALELAGQVNISNASWTFFPDGDLLATGHQNGDILIWSGSTGQMQTVLSPPEATAVNTLHTTPDGQHLVSVYSNGTIGLWALPAGELTHLITLPEGNEPGQIAIHPNNQILTGVMPNGRIHVWDIDSGQETAVLEQYMTGAVRDLTFSPDGQLLAAGQTNGTVNLWQSGSWDAAHAFPDHHGRVDSVAFSADSSMMSSGLGQLIEAGSFDDTIHVWQMADSTLKWQLAGEREIVAGCATFRNRAVFSPDNALLAATSHDFTVQLWQLADGTSAHALEGHTQAIFDLAISPDGETLASVSQDGTLRLWQMRDGTQLHMLKSHPLGVQAVAFSPNGRFVISGAFNGELSLWDVQSGNLLRRLDGTMNSVNISSTIAFSTDGSLVAAGNDHDLLLWSVETGQMLKSLPGNGGNINSVAFSPDGAFVAFGSDSGVIHVWEIPPN